MERLEDEAEKIRTLGADGVYDDDYDDRYDGPADPVVGGALGDQDAIRKANALARQDEEEDAYWAQQTNLNANVKVRAPTKADEAKAPPPSKEKVALQRKRNNKNKSAVANHHRKDRALRKGAF